MTNNKKQGKSNEMHIVNREISWLSFNHRVLQEADDPRVPLIERIRFLGIYSNNLDEFFKVRVASVRRMIDLKINPQKSLGDSPKNILQEIQKRVIRYHAQFESIYAHLKDELGKEGIVIVDEKKINEKQGAYIHQYFKNIILPSLTVLLLSKDREFPYLKDKSIYLMTKMSNQDKTKHQYALIEIPSDMHSRFLVLPKECEKNFVMLLDDVIRYCLSDVFSIYDYAHFEAYTIKLTRDAELDIDNDVSKSFLEKISSGVLGRSKGQPVRFIYDAEMPRELVDFIKEKLQLDDHDNIIAGGRYHNFKDFMKFPSLGRKDLEHVKTKPLKHKAFHKGASSNMLDVIAKKDVMLHFPYHDFLQYIFLLKEASIDPAVQSIYVTLYRVAEDSKVVNALVNAAQNGKKVIVNIELQARFDEEANIAWSKKLEEAGATVLFGIAGLKVHSKLTLISRKEKGRNMDYACVGTGNFHEGTATLYTDLLLMTSDTRITRGVKRVFKLFQNTYGNFTFRNLLVSPLNQRRNLARLIDNEIKLANEEKPALIIMKMNSLVDKDLIFKLYQASCAGVEIRLIVRGICCLVPGVEGMSENIEVVSIVDKFLEHSRIFVFGNNENPLYYISSADWMGRNLDYRVEVTCPVLDKKIKKELQDYLDIQLNDNVKARVINAEQDNTYKKTDMSYQNRSQLMFYEYYAKRDVENRELTWESA